ncbi:MAG TPA: peptidoglycan recognition family protein [Phycisphaerae bacterium]|nr:peptidoglycan recognition family protein [Phycisphaerae bacterium]
MPDGWIPAAAARQWKWIVLHHSASDGGSAELFDQWHRQRGWDELGYHFVITNGHGGGDGRVEVGGRWTKQKWGAHCKVPGNAYNDQGIGICLVGDFQDHPPSAAQLASLGRLVEFLCARYDIDPDDVIGHRDAPGTRTECPGNAMQRYIDSALRPRLKRQSRLAKSR